MLGRVLILAGALLLAIPAASWAVPGDDGIALLSPANGAQVPMPSSAQDALANPIAFEFTCPRYLAFVGAFSESNWTSYFGEIATRPDLGPDGALALAFRAGSFSAFPANAAETACRSTSTAFYPTQPGTYYWQVHRICVDSSDACSPDNYSPVYALTVTAPAGPPQAPSGDSPSAPSAPLRLAGRTARSATRSVIMRRTRRGAFKIRMRCTRRSRAAYRCQTSWATRRYAWSGTMRIDLDSGQLYYRFKGYRASFACVRRHSAIRPCLRKVHW